ncbi:hypothetical protein [Polyangium spumosum]|uniref:Uncharacterized protein n=1 Tax=Polyangium spumosum TaxID=889282 RepID=A0A6N7PMW1_9BACT|nr:hypothetical protein [Polyangium spumosum]MRG93348.1 hypothetical protein [Polyangium spumosum]
MPGETQSVTVSMDLPSSLLLQRLRALGRLLGLGVRLGGRTLDLFPEAAAAERSPSWSAGDIQRPETLNFSTGRPEPGGLLCPSIFGNPPDLRRCGHVALVEPVVPWPARQLLAPLLAMTEEEILELSYKDPAALVARVDEAEAAGRQANGWCPKELVWWSIPVISPPLRAATVEESQALVGEACFCRTLHDAYRRIVNRRNRLRRLKELEAPAVIVENERRMSIEAVDELLANFELENFRTYDDVDEGHRKPMMDATRLFFEALTPALVEAARKNPGGSGWITEAVRIGDAEGGRLPIMRHLWTLAAKRPQEPLGEELMKVLVLSGLEPLLPSK